MQYSSRAHLPGPNGGYSQLLAFNLLQPYVHIEREAISMVRRGKRSPLACYPMDFSGGDFELQTPIYLDYFWTEYY
jgi:hypothetical protein